MTALKPLENRRVRGVASERYPLNEKCAHPECTEPAVDPHHIFPRSAIGNDSWFVLVVEDEEGNYTTEDPIPHVSGLCRKHHDDLEEHRAWVKLEEGVFSWHIQVPPPEHELERWESETGEHRDSYPLISWSALGPLNPQPGSREGKPKRKKKGQARSGQSQTWTLRAPKGESMEPFFELLEQAQFRLQNYYESQEPPLPYITLVAVLHDWLNGGT